MTTNTTIGLEKAAEDYADVLALQALLKIRADKAREAWRAAESKWLETSDRVREFEADLLNAARNNNPRIVNSVTETVVPG